MTKSESHVHYDPVMNEDKDMEEKQSLRDLVSLRNKSEAVIILINFALESETWDEFRRKVANVVTTTKCRFEPEHNEVLRQMCWNIGNPSYNDIPEELKQYFKEHYSNSPF